MPETSYRGPYTYLTTAESHRVMTALKDRDDDEARAIVDKCRATVNAHPAFRTPTAT